LGPKGEEEVFARAVVPAVPARELTALLPRPELSGLADLPYPPVAEVFFGFAGEPGGRALDGFGFLVPEVEKRRILGTLWLSSLFPGRVPAGGAAMTTFVGGRRQPELASLPDDELAELVLDELSELTGLVRTPDLIRIERFPEAIPQYTVGHRERLDRLALLEKNEAGLFIGSNVAGGISVGDRIRFGTELAERVRIYLEGGGGR
jgi:oxygen-dependent protoporphyrinogen oxidase